MSKKVVYLVDGTSICYRSFFALKLSNSRGLPTGAVYGFYQTIKKIITRFKPTYMGICFDVSRRTHRQEKFKEYKIQRPPTPDDLKTQIPLVKKLVNYMGIALIEEEGYEADDIIASLTKKAINDNLNVVIVASDKDLYQLIEENKVEVYNPNQDTILDTAAFIKEYEFPPKLIIDYLSLTGDSSDNIPGAKGIGKVGAAKLIKSLGTIENIFNNLDTLPVKTQDILIANKDSIFLSKELVKLYEKEYGLSWDDLTIKEGDRQEIYKMFTDFEFKTLLKDFTLPAQEVIACPKLSLDEIKKLTLERLVFYVIIDKAFILNNTQVYQTDLQNLKDILADKNISKITYDFKTQLDYLKDVPVSGSLFDVKIAAYIIDSSLVDYNMETLVSQYLNQLVPALPAAEYPNFCDKLYEIFLPKLKQENSEKLFYEVELPLSRILWEMENQGIRMNANILDKLLTEVDLELNQLSKDIFGLAKKEFNLNSPKQLSEVLFIDLKIQPVKKTKTGFSTNEEVLEKLAPKYKIAELLLEYRQFTKLKNTYIVPLAEEVKLKSGWLHAKFNQTATATGRLSSSSPNLQSIPAKGKFSDKLRRAFISSFDNGYILSADYSQIELRLLAHFCGDENLVKAFKTNADIHKVTAALLFSCSQEEVNDNQRDLAKKINFAILYGMGNYGLSQELKISVPEAEAFIASYFLRYPKVQGYIQEVSKSAASLGFATTILGRRRYLADINNTNFMLREFAHRQAINTPIQGSCADLIKVAMVSIAQQFKDKKIKSHLIMQIHDELVFDVCSDEIELVKKIVQAGMEEALQLNVPLKVNLKYGKNWADLDC